MPGKEIKPCPLGCPVGKLLQFVQEKTIPLVYTFPLFFSQEIAASASVVRTVDVAKPRQLSQWIDLNLWRGRPLYLETACRSGNFPILPNLVPMATIPKRGSAIV